MVRDDRYKLVVQAENLRPVEMYDTREDNAELKNLVNEPSLESIRNKLVEKHLKNLTSRMDEEKYQRFRNAMAEALKAGRGPAYARGISWFPEDE
jgi:arylsulfatase A-like enzyme